MKVREVPISKVVPYPGNPRIAGAAVAKVKASLQEFGFQQPIVVDGKWVIIAGHTRHAAALDLGMERVPVVVADGLSEAQARAYRIADNRTGAEAAFDPELLRVELADLAGTPLDLATLGFDVAELDTLLSAPEPEQRRARAAGLGTPVISYGLVFDDEGQQAVWFDFLRDLKGAMPQEETIAARLTRYLREAGYGAGP